MRGEDGGALELGQDKLEFVILKVTDSSSASQTLTGRSIRDRGSSSRLHIL